MFKNVHQMQKQVFFTKSQELFDQPGWFDKNTKMTNQWKKKNQKNLTERTKMTDYNNNTNLGS